MSTPHVVNYLQEKMGFSNNNVLIVRKHLEISTGEEFCVVYEECVFQRSWYAVGVQVIHSCDSIGCI